MISLPEIQTTSQERTRARRAAGLRRYDSCPVEVIPGSADEPEVTGSSWHYETRGGRRIWHPSTYSRTGWSNMVYCGSTRCVVVGELWLRPQSAAA